jgi:hypothetical protein
LHQGRGGGALPRKTQRCERRDQQDVQISWHGSVSRECLLPEVRRVVNGVRESRFSQLRMDLQTTDDKGNRQHYTPWRLRIQRRKKVTARRCSRQPAARSSKRSRNMAAMKGPTSPTVHCIHLLPWRVKPVISQIAETEGWPQPKVQRADQPVCHASRKQCSP